MIVEDRVNPSICIIAATGEERILIPVYDNSITTGLTVGESLKGLGKFSGWKDPNTGEIFAPRSGAYPKPIEPYELFGIECGEGWRELINPIIDWIKDYNNNHSKDEQIEIEQIKEKFGGLRIYVNPCPDELHSMIVKAEGDSYGVCEVCGSKTNVGHTCGWIKTICRQCVEDEVKHSEWKRQIKWKSKDDGIMHLITKEEDREI